jgi:UPF0271 protein
MGYDPLGARAEQYTVSAVVDEVRDRAAKIRIRTAIELEVLKVVRPTVESREKVINQSTRLGDIGKISTTDVDVLALTLDILASGQRCLLVTDDYAVQNVAHQMGVSFKPLATPGIRHQFFWRLYCPACGRSYPSSFTENVCPICGTPLRRRVSRKRRIREP